VGIHCVQQKSYRLKLQRICSNHLPCINHAAAKIQRTDGLPKSVNLFLGRCINSAYSLSPSILWSCSTSGRRVTMPTGRHPNKTDISEHIEVEDTRKPHRQLFVMQQPYLNPWVGNPSQLRSPTLRIYRNSVDHISKVRTSENDIVSATGLEMEMS
jgi:hypothetical protein